MSETTGLPAGFERYGEPSPFLDRVGPLYQLRDGDRLVIAARILDHHCNNKGVAHGGLFATLADITLGKTASWRSEPRVPLLTTSLTVDYVAAARLGDWIEGEADFERVGRDLAFANCYIRAGERLLARASGVYKVVRRT